MVWVLFWGWGCFVGRIPDFSLLRPTWFGLYLGFGVALSAAFLFILHCGRHRLGLEENSSLFRRPHSCLFSVAADTASAWKGIPACFVGRNLVFPSLRPTPPRPGREFQFVLSAAILFFLYCGRHSLIFAGICRHDDEILNKLELNEQI